MTFLYQAHSGLRYLVLLAGVIALAACLYGVLARRAVPASRGLTSAFAGLLDLQILLGVGLILGGIFYGALMGHLVMMLLAAVAVHVAAIMSRRTSDERRALVTRLTGIALALVCIVGGIMAIGRSIFGSSAPTVTG